MILLTDEENPYHKGLMEIDRVSEDAFNKGAKAQLKKLYDEYECKECSTPGFVHLVLPRQSLLEEVA